MSILVKPDYVLNISKLVSVFINISAVREMETGTNGHKEKERLAQKEGKRKERQGEKTKRKKEKNEKRGKEEERKTKNEKKENREAENCIYELQSEDFSK